MKTLSKCVCLNVRTKSVLNDALDIAIHRMRFERANEQKRYRDIGAISYLQGSDRTEYKRLHYRIDTLGRQISAFIAIKAEIDNTPVCGSLDQF